MNFPNYEALDTLDRAGAFGLLCSARLLAVAALGDFPCAGDLGALVRAWGECADIAPQVVSLTRYSARFPYRDDVESPNYYRSLSVDLALMSIDFEQEQPAARARRLMFMATQAWGNLDDIVSSRGLGPGEFCKREMESQARDISSISSGSEVRPAYLACLAHYREEYQERALYFGRVASLLSWS
ncbi:hypothetical protein ABTZ03_09585 [Kitasatospora sp. NPDC096077]|uniref:hypothetical protein n=1 Tax=Kitasatospora sp. NPDC096077 TaxID=3155544 RepID=UPI003325F0C2